MDETTASAPWRLSRLHCRCVLTDEAQRLTELIDRIDKHSSSKEVSKTTLKNIYTAQRLLNEQIEKHKAIQHRHAAAISEQVKHATLNAPVRPTQRSTPTTAWDLEERNNNNNGKAGKKRGAKKKRRQ